MKRQQSFNQNHSTSRSLLTTRLIQNFRNRSVTDFGSIGRKPFAPWLARDPVFVGRETELQILEHTFKRIMTSQKSEIVTLHGPSGVGKTAFVTTFVKTLTSSVLFASGKFDQLKSQAPYSTLVAASESLCRQIMRQENYEEIRDRMRSVLGSEISGLVTLIPELGKMNISTSIDGSMIPPNNASFQRFKQLLRSFFRCVASAVNPIVLFLDDIQWADATSKEVLEFLIHDVLSRNILILVSYREGQISPNYLGKLNFPSHHSHIVDLSVTNEIEIDVLQNTDIYFEKLDKVDFISMISLILQVERYTVESLGALLWNKTDGNPFYALTFLELLYSSGMLNQLSDGRWIWDENQIWLQTDVTENLAKMLGSKLQRLPDQSRSILQIASFIGHEFSSDILTSILYEEQDMIEGTYSFDRHSKEIIRDCIDDAMILASKEGLVEKTSDSIMYKFAHDSIAQVLYEDFMPDVCERQLLHRRIGYLLRESLRGACNQQMNKDLIIFLATKNFNHALKAIDSAEERYEVAELNLMAGKLAMDKSDYLQAAEYLGIALNLVQGVKSWTSHYDFCINLYSVAAEVEKINANYERSNDLVMEIHARAISQQHCCAAFKIQIGCLAAKGDIKASISLGLEVLKHLDVKIPKHFTVMTIAKEFLFTRAALGRRKVSYLLNLPELKDEKIINAFFFMDAVLVSAFLLGDDYKEMFAYFSLRMLRSTIKYGLSPIYTPLAILSWGTITAGNGDLSTAIECEKVAFAIIERYQSDAIRGRAMIGTYGTIHFWKNKLDDNACQQMLLAYHLAMSFGDIFFAKFGILEWIAARTYLDHSLEETNQLMRIFVGDLREDGAKQALILILPKWQFLLNLCGDEKNANSSLLRGEALNECLADEIQQINSQLALLQLSQNEMMAAYFFGDLENLLTTSTKFIKHARKVAGLFPTDFSFFWAGLCFYELFLSKQCAQYRREAIRAHRKVKRWVDAGAHIFTAPEALLSAVAALCIKSQQHQIEKKFLAAIHAFADVKCILLEAFAYERLAKYFLASVTFQNKGQEYLGRAIELYRRWGAAKKAVMLEDLHFPSTGYVDTRS